MCQHSWKVITFTRSKTPSADQRSLVHHSCMAERWMHSGQTVHSKVALWNNELLLIELSGAISGSTKCPFVSFFAATTLWTTNHCCKKGNDATILTILGRNMHNIVSSRRCRNEEWRRCLIWPEKQRQHEMPTVYIEHWLQQPCCKPEAFYPRLYPHAQGNNIKPQLPLF